MSHRDRSWVLRTIGGLLLLGGAAAAFIGPIEVHTFTLFSEGGRFHYEGFGFGSFMFANIACQVLFYYLLAALGIPLGYGHWRRRRWVRVLALVLLGDWLVVGLPLSLVLLFMLFSAKSLTPALAVMAVAAVGLCYPLVPLLLMRFYRSSDVRMTFEAHDPGPSRLEAVPLPVLVLSSLCLFYAVLLHIPLLANGLFPLFGVWLTGYQGFMALDVAIWGSLALAWAVFQRERWAWWAVVSLLGALAISVIYTLAHTCYAEILALWNLPPAELGWLRGIPLQSYQIAVLTSLPLLLTVGVAVTAQKHFGARAEAARV